MKIPFTLLSCSNYEAPDPLVWAQLVSTYQRHRIYRIKTGIADLAGTILFARTALPLARQTRITRKIKNHHNSDDIWVRRLCIDVSPWSCHVVLPVECGVGTWKRTVLGRKDAMAFLMQHENDWWAVIECRTHSKLLLLQLFCAYSPPLRNFILRWVSSRW